MLVCLTSCTHPVSVLAVLPAATDMKCPLITPLPPLGYIWDVMLVCRKGNIEKKLSLCYSIVYYYNGAGQSTVSGFDLTWFSSVFRLLSKIKFDCLHPSLYLLVSWACWDWPLMWLTNHRPSVLWRCWLGHLTRKIVSEMTYNVSSRTLNPRTCICCQSRRLLL